MEEIGKKIFNNEPVSDREIGDVLKQVIGAAGTHQNNRSSDTTFKDILVKWTALCDLWKVTTDSRQTLIIGRKLVFMLRHTIAQFCKNDLPWREIEFLMTIFLLRCESDKKKITAEDKVVCDLLLNRGFICGLLTDFTNKLCEYTPTNMITKYEPRADYISNMKQNYPNSEAIFQRFNQLRRYWSLRRIKDLLSDVKLKGSVLINFTSISELLQNTVESPHFPPSQDKFVDEFFLPQELLCTNQSYRYLLGHMINISHSDSIFNELKPIFLNLLPVINFLIANEKLGIATEFISRALTMTVNEFQECSEPFENVQYFELESKADGEIHTIIGKWKNLRKAYSTLIVDAKLDKNKIIPVSTLEYISEILSSYKNYYEIQSNEFIDRINPLLIKIANFKRANTEDGKRNILENLQHSLTGYSNRYKYQKTINIHQRVSSTVNIIQDTFRSYSTANSAEIQSADDIKAFFKYANLEKFPEYCSKLLDDIFSENPYFKDKLKKTNVTLEEGFRKLWLKLSKKSRDEEASSVIVQKEKFVEIQFGKLKEEYCTNKEPSVSQLESFFSVGLEILLLNSSISRSFFVCDWIPVLSGTTLRNYIAHNQHLLLLLPYKYEELLKVNCDKMFQTEPKPNFSVHSTFDFSEWLNYVTSCEPLLTKNLDQIKTNQSWTSMIRFGSVEQVSEFIAINSDAVTQKDCDQILNDAIVRGNQNIFDEVIKNTNCGDDVVGQVFVIKSIVKSFESKITRKGYTPLLLACELGETEMVKKLVKLNCNVFARSNFNYSCYHIAAQRNHTDLYAYLLSLKLEIQGLEMIPIHQFLTSTSKKYMFKPQHVAMQNCSLNVLDLIQKRITELSKEYIFKVKLNGKEYIVELDPVNKCLISKEPTLTGKQVSLCVTDETSKMPETGDISQELKLLFEERPCENTFWSMDNKNTLHMVIESENWKAVQDKLGHAVFESFVDKESLFKLIQFNCQSEDFMIMWDIYKVKDNSANLESLQNTKKWSLLYAAVKYNNENMINCLDLKTHSWTIAETETPLHLLFELKRKSLLKKIEKKYHSEGPFTDFKQHTSPTTKRSLLHYIVINRWDSLITRFDPQIRAVIDDVDIFGNTALHYAKSIGHDGMVETLINLGASKDKQNVFGETYANVQTKN